MQRVYANTLVLAFLLAASPVGADDLAGAENILCTAVQVTLCTADGECQSAPPWELNVPQFIKIDFENKQLGTTEASGENRSSSTNPVP